MNNGNRRRKKYRVRYDRIIAVALVFIILIFAIASCSKGCSNKKDKKKTNSSSIVDDTSSVSQADIPVQTPSDAANSSADPNAAANASSTEYATTKVEYAKINMGDLVLVNSMYEYKFPEGDINVTDIYSNRNENDYSVADMNVLLDSNVITQLNAMMAAFHSATSSDDLRIVSAYRTLEDQNVKHTSGQSKIKGGYSDYHTGRSFNLGIFPDNSGSYYYKPEGIYSWINDNAANYGFILRYPEGKESITGDEASTSIFRYVGAPHATYIKQNNLCLEEYIENVKSYTYGANTLKVTVGTDQYEIYYVPANVNNVTDVPVPTNKTYTISGNNVDGFIVTVSPT